MSLSYDQILHYLQHGKGRHRLAPQYERFNPELELEEPPLDVEGAGGEVYFSWTRDLRPREDFSPSVLMIMAATAVEMYLELFAPPREEGTNPAWRLVEGILADPSNPKVTDTIREREALMYGYRGWNPWEGNRYIRDAVGTLLDSAGRFAREAKGYGSEMNREHAGAAAINSIYGAIRALARASNDIDRFDPILASVADLFYVGERRWTQTLEEADEWAETIFRMWIERWWNRVQQRLAFLDPYTLTLSGRLL